MGIIDKTIYLKYQDLKVLEKLLLKDNLYDLSNYFKEHEIKYLYDILQQVQTNLKDFTVVKNE